MKTLEQKYNWSDWRTFPDPRNCDYLVAPFGFGVYQLKNSKINEFTLFGRSKNLAHRMSSLLPIPLGASGRNNEEKREYVLNNIENIEYRTVAFTSEKEMKDCERELRQLNIHKFNT